MSKKTTRFLAVLLAAVMAFLFPLSAAAVETGAGSGQKEAEDYFYSVTETSAGEDSGVLLHLEIEEKEGVMLNEVILPDQTSVYAEAAGEVPGFKQADGRNVIDYTVAENGTKEFTVSYTKDGEQKEEILSYEVTGIGAEEPVLTSESSGENTGKDVSEETAGEEEADGKKGDEEQADEKRTDEEMPSGGQADGETAGEEEDGPNAINQTEAAAKEARKAAVQRTSGYNGGYTINTNFDFLSDYQFETIWLGTKDGVGLAWQVTKNHGDHVTMVTDSIVGRKKIYPDENAHGWNDSTLRSWLNNYQGDFDGLGTVTNPYADSFLDGLNPCELNAFLETEVVNDESQSLLPISQTMTTLAGVNTRDKFYIPDYNDTKGLTGFNPAKNNLNTNWSTRSLVALPAPGLVWGIFAIHTGEFTIQPGTELGVRPVSNLDLNAVAFLQDYNLYDPQGLQKIGETANSSWKAVLFDPGQKFSVDNASVTKKGKMKFRILFSYQYDRNAENAAGIHADPVVAMITEGDFKNGKVKYYGIVGKVEDGYAEVTLPDSFDNKTDKLYLMSRTVQSRNYVSRPAEVTVPGTEIIYHANGGDGVMDNQLLPFGETGLLTDNQFTRQGYRMTGWNTAEDGSGIPYSNQEIMDENNMDESPLHLYAQWKPVEYQIQYEKNGEDVSGTMDPQNMIYDVSGALTKNAYTRPGYTFTGWTRDPAEGVQYADGETVRNLESEADKTVRLYAVWEKSGDLMHTVEFDSNGGSYTPDRQLVAHGDKAIQPKDPSKEGCLLEGWYYKDKDLKENKWNFEDAVTGDLYLTTRWSKAGETVKPSDPPAQGGNGGTHIYNSGTHINSNSNISPSGTGRYTAGSVKTGDAANLFSVFGLLAGSAAALAALGIIIRKKHGRKRE